MDERAMSLAELGLGAYLEALSSEAAMPGGGAAAALTGAQAAALLLMVCHLTRGPRHGDVAEEIDAVHATCLARRDRLLAIAEADGERFEAVLAAQRLPRATPEERRERTRRRQAALVEAARLPLEALEESTALLPQASRLVEIGNPHLVSDVGVALRLIEAAMHSARLNVLINLRSITDRGFADACRARIEGAMAGLEREAPPCLAAVERALSPR